jgi:hypothetical protein
MFFEQFFPEPPPSAPYQPVDDPEPTRDAVPLTYHEVENAIGGCRLDTAPGPSGVNYKAVKWTWSACPELLFYLFSHCVGLGHYPSPFKHSTTAVVPKPNKNDYTVPGAFRPVQLTECLGKILDKIMAKRIQYEVAANGIVPLTQFGGRIHSSTVDAGLAFTQEIHNAWDQGLKASALFFDISGYFNFVNHKGLLERLQHYGFSTQTTAFVDSFISNRSTTITYDGYQSSTLPILVGIPQGSPLSPILSIIYGSELQKLKELIRRRVISFAYVDDGALLVFSSTLEINIKKLEKAFNVVFHWLTNNGLEVQVAKVELMHFTRGPDSSSPPLHLFNQHSIVAPKTIRWLGFHLDRHLHFTHHTRILAERASATVCAMKILGNTVRGMSHVQIRRQTPNASRLHLMVLYNLFAELSRQHPQQLFI